MIFRCHIEMDNAAFEENPDELADILLKLSNKIRNGSPSTTLLDSNGNKVGEYVVED